MSEVKTGPVLSTLVDSIVDEGAPAGAIKFYETAEHKPAGFHFQCPCGCRSVGGVTVAGPGAWTWNGSCDKPTVRASVLLHNPDMSPHWHGYLTDGVWESC
ncbi:DUF6527 family protein [Mesorhizobium sp. M0701]|uniref:DUF6527 family protein n=1 Tax=Mesorhizobium sp. M0701 TaxID=2956989 RepID=UPI003336F7E0